MQFDAICECRKRHVRNLLKAAVNRLCIQHKMLTQIPVQERQTKGYLASNIRARIIIFSKFK